MLNLNVDVKDLRVFCVRISKAYERMAGVDRCVINGDGDVASVMKQIEDELSKRGICFEAIGRDVGSLK